MDNYNRQYRLCWGGYTFYPSLNLEANYIILLSFNGYRGSNTNTYVEWITILFIFFHAWKFSDVSRARTPPFWIWAQISGISSFEHHVPVLSAKYSQKALFWHSRGATAKTEDQRRDRLYSLHMHQLLHEQQHLVSLVYLHHYLLMPSKMM